MSVPIRVLILEDRPTDAELLLHELRRAGFEPDWRQVDAEPDYLAHLGPDFDVILSDYHMPQFDPIRALQLLQERNLDIPFILVTGALGDETAVECIKHGVTDYVLKDRMARLGPVVQRALDDKRLRDERREVEEALRESEQRFRDLYEGAPHTYFSVGLDGSIQLVNQRATELLGYSRDTLIGCSVLDLYADTANGKEKAKRLNQRILAGEDIHDEQLEMRRADGSSVWISLTVRLIWDLQGELVERLAMVVDITERKQAEEALQESNLRLKRAMAELKVAQARAVQQERLQALGQMASGIAHDFNNALTPIQGFSEMLLMRPERLDDKEAVKRDLQLINLAAQDAASVVRRLRDFYRPTTDFEVFAAVSLNDLVAQVISLTQASWKDQPQARGININIASDLGDTPNIQGNEAELREALANLILNAVDAMPEGGTIKLRTRLDGDHVVVEARDTGTGMSEEVRNRCLEPFFTTKGRAGTGMGLAMVVSTVRRHSGTIDIESEVGRGTTFIIRLPIQLRREAKRKPKIAEAHSCNVLVVDDEPMVRQVLIGLLTGDGHTVETASNGQEALEKFHLDKYDFVLTDRAMPGMSGDQLAAAIKEIAPRQQVIMLTGFVDLMEEAHETAIGVDFILGKPVDHNELRRALAQVRARGSTE